MFSGDYHEIAREGAMVINPSEPEHNEPYFIGLGRAMVSLGPISRARYCPFSCRFCYVQGPFPKYAASSPLEIVTWLKSRREQFHVIYVSGDTDSFAPGRTQEGLALLDMLCELEVDVLFTSRHLFSSQERLGLQRIGDGYRRKGTRLIACVSVSQLEHPTLEPPPIRSPLERIEQLAHFHEMSLVTILTIRPLIPGIPSLEYQSIVQLAHQYADVVLGGDLYLDSAGVIENLIGAAIGPLPLATARAFDQQLDFSMGTQQWHVVEHREARAEVAELCARLNKPFFMRSGPALDWIRANCPHR